MGCGPQEEFRACSDVSILDHSGKASSEEDNTHEEEDEDNVVDTGNSFSNLTIHCRNNKNRT